MPRERRPPAPRVRQTREFRGAARLGSARPGRARAAGCCSGRGCRERAGRRHRGSAGRANSSGATRRCRANSAGGHGDRRAQREIVSAARRRRAGLADSRRTSRRHRPQPARGRCRPATGVPGSYPRPRSVATTSRGRANPEIPSTGAVVASSPRRRLSLVVHAHLPPVRDQNSPSPPPLAPKFAVRPSFRTAHGCPRTRPRAQRVRGRAAVVPNLARRASSGVRRAPGGGRADGRPPPHFFIVARGGGPKGGRRERSRVPARPSSYDGGRRARDRRREGNALVAPRGASVAREAPFRRIVARPSSAVAKNHGGHRPFGAHRRAGPLCAQQPFRPAQLLETNLFSVGSALAGRFRVPIRFCLEDPVRSRAAQRTREDP